MVKLLGSLLAIVLSYQIYNYKQSAISDTIMPSSRTFSLDARHFNPTLYSNLLKIWFEGLPEGATCPTDQLGMRWFGLGASENDKASFDKACHSGFHEVLSSISPTKFPLPAFTDADADHTNYPDIAAPFVGQFYQNNSRDPDAGLGLTLLLDQIPRNIFRRDQALIYGHYDRIARAVFYAVHNYQLDKHERYAMSPVHRTWFYLPLMHSESLADHQLFGQQIDDLKSGLEVKDDHRAAQYVGQTLSFGKRHVDILKKFGRYPHRNEWLGREMTDEEREWLDQGGDTFSA